MRYPEARRLDLVEELHGTPVADPYRWLEDLAAPEVRTWLDAQAALYAGALAAWPARAGARERLGALMPGAVGTPRFRGPRTFLARRDKGQDQAVVLVREGSEERVVLDPADLSDDGTVVLLGWEPSPDGRHLAGLVDVGGREEVTARIWAVDGGAEVGPPLLLGRGGQLGWGADDELLLVATLPDLPADEAQFHRRVWRLPLGAGRDQAELLFGEGRDRTTYYGIGTSADGRWLTISCSLGTAPRNDLYVVDRHAPGPVRPVPALEGEDAQAFGEVLADGRLVLWTDRGAPRGRLVVADPAAPATWDELVPERDDVLVGWAATDAALFAAWQRDVVTVVTAHDRATGAERGEVPLPGPGTASLVARRGGVGDDLFLTYTDELTPSRVLHHRPSTGATEPWAEAPGAPADDDRLEVVQTFATSADGTRVPLFVARRRDVPLDGTAPTVLYGYGGFQISLTPAYSARVRAWVEGGGVWATACLRGGGEHGEAWHRDGMRDRKQHVFEDHEACARWLIESGHTSPEHLAVAGGSNGGLLVGAALTRFPELLRAVWCSAPLLDMVRYELFGLGTTWNDEYGRADDPVELGWLLGYSPYHHVREGVRYPAVLFTTYGGDTRVDPLHARKTCAALQHATASPPGDRPVLLRHEEHVGHGARTVGRSLDESAEVLAFLGAQVGWPKAGC